MRKKNTNYYFKAVFFEKLRIVLIKFREYLKYLSLQNLQSRKQDEILLLKSVSVVSELGLSFFTNLQHNICNN